MGWYWGSRDIQTSVVAQPKLRFNFVVHAGAKKEVLL
jgi:hypothetical protein